MAQEYAQIPATMMEQLPASYHPYANSVMLNERSPGVLMHELGHGIDLAPREGEMPLKRHMRWNVKPTLWKELSAWKKGRKAFQEGYAASPESDSLSPDAHSQYASNMASLNKRKYPAFGTYLGGAAGLAGGLGLGGLGMYLALKNAGNDPESQRLASRFGAQLMMLSGTLGAGAGVFGGALAGKGYASLRQKAHQQKAMRQLQKLKDDPEALQNVRTRLAQIRLKRKVKDKPQTKAAGGEKQAIWPFKKKPAGPQLGEIYTGGVHLESEDDVEAYLGPAMKSDILQFLRENPGASFDDFMAHQNGGQRWLGKGNAAVAETKQANFDWAKYGPVTGLAGGAALGGIHHATRDKDDNRSSMLKDVGTGALLGTAAGAIPSLMSGGSGVVDALRPGRSWSQWWKGTKPPVTAESALAGIREHGGNALQSITDAFKGASEKTGWPQNVNGGGRAVGGSGLGSKGPPSDSVANQMHQTNPRGIGTDNMPVGGAMGLNQLKSLPQPNATAPLQNTTAGQPPATQQPATQPPTPQQGPTRRPPAPNWPQQVSPPTLARAGQKAPPIPENLPQRIKPPSAEWNAAASARPAPSNLTRQLPSPPAGDFFGSSMDDPAEPPSVPTVASRSGSGEDSMPPPAGDIRSGSRNDNLPPPSVPTGDIRAGSRLESRLPPDDSTDFFGSPTMPTSPPQPPSKITAQPAMRRGSRLESGGSPSSIPPIPTAQSDLRAAPMQSMRRNARKPGTASAPPTRTYRLMPPQEREPSVSEDYDVPLSQHVGGSGLDSKPPAETAPAAPAAPAAPPASARPAGPVSRYAPQLARARAAAARTTSSPRARAAAQSEVKRLNRMEQDLGGETQARSINAHRRRGPSLNQRIATSMQPGGNSYKAQQRANQWAAGQPASNIARAPAQPTSRATNVMGAGKTVGAFPGPSGFAMGGGGGGASAAPTIKPSITGAGTAGGLTMAGGGSSPSAPAVKMGSALTPMARGFILGCIDRDMTDEQIVKAASVVARHFEHLAPDMEMVKQANPLKLVGKGVQFASKLLGSGAKATKSIRGPSAASKAVGRPLATAHRPAPRPQWSRYSAAANQSAAAKKLRPATSTPKIKTAPQQGGGLYSAAKPSESSYAHQVWNAGNATKKLRSPPALPGSKTPNPMQQSIIKGNKGGPGGRRKTPMQQSIIEGNKVPNWARLKLKPNKPTGTGASPPVVRARSSRGSRGNELDQAKGSVGVPKPETSKINITPEQVRAGPSRIKITPEEVRAGPSTVRITPEQVAGPSKINITPQQVRAGPSKINITPEQVRAGPSKINITPEQVGGSSTVRITPRQVGGSSQFGGRSSGQSGTGNATAAAIPMENVTGAAGRATGAMDKARTAMGKARTAMGKVPGALNVGGGIASGAYTGHMAEQSYRDVNNPDGPVALGEGKGNTGIGALIGGVLGATGLRKGPRGLPTAAAAKARKILGYPGLSLNTGVQTMRTLMPAFVDRAADTTLATIAPGMNRDRLSGIGYAVDAINPIIRDFRALKERATGGSAGYLAGLSPEQRASLGIGKGEGGGFFGAQGQGLPQQLWQGAKAGWRGLTPQQQIMMGIGGGLAGGGVLAGMAGKPKIGLGLGALGVGAAGYGMLGRPGAGLDTFKAFHAGLPEKQQDRFVEAVGMSPLWQQFAAERDRLTPAEESAWMQQIMESVAEKGGYRNELEQAQGGVAPSTGGAAGGSGGQ